MVMMLSPRVRGVVGQGRFLRYSLGLAFFFFTVVSVSAQNFRPFTALRVIQTAHFEIIYPAESEPTARTLAGFADSVYERVSGLLGIAVDRRIPVTITPHTDEFNGYMSLMPSPYILLFDAPMDPDSFIYRNSLEGLFLHELTHAVSLSSRGPFFKVLHRIFGGWAAPTALNAPKFMVEGVTVSFESLDGFGRANDPLIREGLRQAIYEDAFLSPFQAAGVYDLPPAQSAYYYYGGLFSAYLQRQYGMEKYAELWRAMGRSYHFSFFFYNNGYFHIFKEVYGLPLLTAWDDFKASLGLEGIEENTGGFIAGGKVQGAPGDGVVFPGGKAIINGTASGGGRVFFLDRISRKVFAFDPRSDRVSAVVKADNSAYSLAASAEGDRLLVSSYHYTGELARAVVTEYDTRRGGKTGRTWQGLYGGRYFRDGLIGLSSTLHSNNLVFRTAGGGEEVLLRGNAELLYADPCALDDRRIVFIAAEKGRRRLCLYDYETKAVYAVESDLEDDGPRWQYIRGLRVSEGHILFSYDHDDRMYKLGIAEIPPEVPPAYPTESLPDTPDTPEFLTDTPVPPAPAGEVVFAERDFSGGVFLPVLADGDIYYRGAFAAWDALMKYPEGGGMVRGRRAPLRLRLLNGGELAPAWAAAFDPGPPGGEPEPLKSRAYIPLKYLNPLRLWLPLPLLSLTGDSGSIDGAGFFSYMADPTDNNAIFMSAFMDFRLGMAPVDIQWTNLSLGFPLNIHLADQVDKTSRPFYRMTQGTLSGQLSHGLGSNRRRFSLYPGMGFSFYSLDPGNGSSPYAWRYEVPSYYGLLGVGFSTMGRFAWDLFGQGLSLAAYARYLLPANTPRFEGMLQAAFEPYLPLKLVLYGAWDVNGMNIQGGSPHYGSAVFSDYSSPEYAGALLNLPWLGGGEVTVKLFSVETQRGLSHLYFNRIFGTLAYRGVFYDDRGGADAEGNSLGGPFRLAQSLALRLGLTSSTAIVAAQPVKFSLWVLGAWKISNLNDQSPNDFWFGPGFSLEM
jgi:hypothetical protein